MSSKARCYSRLHPPPSVASHTPRRGTCGALNLAAVECGDVASGQDLCRRLGCERRFARLSIWSRAHRNCALGLDRPRPAQTALRSGCCPASCPDSPPNGEKTPKTWGTDAGISTPLTLRMASATGWRARPRRRLRGPASRRIPSAASVPRPVADRIADADDCVEHAEQDPAPPDPGGTEWVVDRLDNHEPSHERYDQARPQNYPATTEACWRWGRSDLCADLSGVHLEAFR